jgi:hypothetical protein
MHWRLLTDASSAHVYANESATPTSLPPLHGSYAIIACQTEGISDRHAYIAARRCANHSPPLFFLIH